MRTSQPRPLERSVVYLALPTSCSLPPVISTSSLAGLRVPLRDLDLARPTGDGDLLRSSSSISALLPLLSLGDETDEVLRRLRGAYRSIDPLLFPLRGLLVRLRLRLRLTLRDRLLLGLRRRRGVMLRSRLLLRVSRCSSRSRPLRLDVAFALMRSRSGLREARLRTGDLPRALEERDAERDRDRDGELALRLLRDLGGGERLLETDGDLLRLRGGGEGERELVEEKDLRRRRSGLRPLPLPPRPR